VGKNHNFILELACVGWSCATHTSSNLW